jgi:hypothetical protein
MSLFTRERLRFRQARIPGRSRSFFPAIPEERLRPYDAKTNNSAAPIPCQLNDYPCPVKIPNPRGAALRFINGRRGGELLALSCSRRSTV